MVNFRLDGGETELAPEEKQLFQRAKELSVSMIRILLSFPGIWNLPSMRAENGSLLISNSAHYNESGDVTELSVTSPLLLGNYLRYW